MKNKNITIFVFLFAVIIISAKLYLNKVTHDEAQAHISDLKQFNKPINIYTDHSDIYSVAFNEDKSKILLNGLAFHDMIFTRVTSSSSIIRYEDTSKIFVFWNKEEKFTLYRGENTIMFVGSTNKADYEIPTITN